MIDQSEIYLQHNRQQQGPLYISAEMSVQSQIQNEPLFRALYYPNQIYSYEEPKEEDFEETKNLEGLMNQEFNLQITVEAQQKRDKVLVDLLELLKGWIISIYKSYFKREEGPQNIDEHVRLYKFGSSFLGVSFSDGDIDTVCVTPCYVSRDSNFFGDFVQILQKNTRISDIECVKEAYVPVMKFKFDSISIDIIFANLKDNKIDVELLESGSDEILKYIYDDVSIRSLNGYRVACIIQKNVKNIDNFRMTLKLVKFWANQRGIYNNKLGYLGGISWAILVAKICQMYPNLLPNQLLVKFFALYAQLEWENFPIRIVDDNVIESSIFPRMPMRIYTPTQPIMNSAHKVTISTCQIIQKQLRIALDSLKKVKRHEKNWNYFFRELEFFREYKHFIEVNILTKDNYQEFLKWRGQMEPQLKKLTERIENYRFLESSAYVHLDIHLYPVPFFVNIPDFKYSVSYYYGLGLKQKEMYIKEPSIDMRIPIFEFISELTQHPLDCTMRFKHLLRHELHDDIFKGERPKWATKQNKRLNDIDTINT